MKYGCLYILGDSLGCDVGQSDFPSLDCIDDMDDEDDSDEEQENNANGANKSIR